LILFQVLILCGYQLQISKTIYKWPDLPTHVNLTFFPLETITPEDVLDVIQINNSSCTLCNGAVDEKFWLQCYDPSEVDCTMIAHVPCLAQWFLGVTAPDFQLIPNGGQCPSCSENLSWPYLLKNIFKSERESDE
jgi:hypothetical protein